MAIKTRPTSLLIVFSLLLLAASLSLAYEREDPSRQDPEKEYQQCRLKCQLKRQGPEEQRRCQEVCKEQREQREREEGHGGGRIEKSYSEGGESRGQHGREEMDNPYYFHHERFRGHIISQEGSIRALDRFSKSSKLLEGIDNYRVTLFEANPNTFMIPGHWDADCLWVVLDGRGAVSLLRENNKETHNLECGDVFRIHAGTTVHLVNRDNNKKLYIAELTIPVNTPGQYESFFATRGGDQESFFNVFSNEILEAAFNTEKDQLRKLFEGQNKGVFVKASEAQIRALSGSSSSEEQSVWPFHHHGESGQNRPCNLFKKESTYSNRYGRLHEVDPSDYQQLKDLDITVSFANITRGAMHAPFYNSRATKIAFVASGNGYFEMACPHMSQQGRGSSEGGQQGSGSTSYQKVSARLSRGDVFVVPAGHPVVGVASNDQNIQVVCFEINAQNNQRYQLAGRNNIFKQLEKEAKQLSFNTEAREVDELFSKQEESWFFPGPQQRGRHASA